LQRDYGGNNNRTAGTHAWQLSDLIVISVNFGSAQNTKHVPRIRSCKWLGQTLGV